MTEGIAPAFEQVDRILREEATRSGVVTEELVNKIFFHEHAVQFDEKRFEAANYIRGLVIEQLDDEMGQETNADS